MKKSILILGLSLVLLTAFGLDAKGQPKEVTESVTTTYYATAKLVPLGADRGAMSYDAIGLTVSDTGQGLFHQGVVRIIGSLTSEKGKWDDERGVGVWNLMNGDKVFVTVKGAGQVSPQPGAPGITKGTVTITGGTGKCSGIQGSFEFTRYNIPKPAVEGIIQSYVKANITYKLP
jgi:hypothetical protein